MTTLALSDLRRDKALQQRLRDAHWRVPESSKALGVAEAMQAALRTLSIQQVVIKEDRKP